MSLNIKKISEEDYVQLDCRVLFENNLTDRAFGVISNKDKHYKFSWQSDIVQPSIIEIKNNIYSVGIDLNYTIVDFNKNTVLLRIELENFLLKTLIYNNTLYVITELEVYLISIINFSVIEMIDLPDIFIDIVFEEDSVNIKCFGGEKVLVN
ncbi:hypothetical protein FO675_00060 [Riemerella anatipestifer]|uniref:hypothetical protein n=1 Tax=Riemerella anatipestifer TaxID=34085 RepID=UPI001AD77631|nr:hypothetical protein [Riemerella anatipestifer]MBO4232713.1 hypothetical protein [Riemerella anatipestifer]